MKRAQMPDHKIIARTKKRSYAATIPDDFFDFASFWMKQATAMDCDHVLKTFESFGKKVVRYRKGRQKP